MTSASMNRCLCCLLLLTLVACESAPPQQPTQGVVSAAPTIAPTAVPTVAPPSTPTDAPTPAPTDAPTIVPTATPLQLPEQTISADTIDSLQPLWSLGVGRALQAAFAPDGTLLAVATTAGVSLFELPALRQVRFDQAAGVASVVFSPNSAYLALIGNDGETVQLRSVRDGAVLATTGGQGAQFSPDSSILAVEGRSADSEPLTMLLDTSDGRTLNTLNGGSASFGLNGLIATVVRPFQPDALTILARADGQLLSEFAGQEPTFSPDGSLLTTTSYQQDGTTSTAVWNSADGTPLSTVQGNLATFSPAGAMLATAQGREVRLWPMPAATNPLTLTVEPPNPESYSNTDVIALAFSPDGRLLHAVVGGDLYVWRVAGGERVGLYPGVAQAGGQPDAHFSPDATLFRSLNVVGDADCGLFTGLRLVRVSNGDRFFASDQGIAASFSRNGNQAAIVTSTGQVIVLNVADGQTSSVNLAGYGALAFSPAGAKLALSQMRDGSNPFGPSAIEVWDVASNQPERTLTVDSYTGEPTALHYSADGSSLVAKEESSCDFVYQVAYTGWQPADSAGGTTRWRVPEIANEPYPAAAALHAYSSATGAGAWADENGLVRLATNGITSTLELPAPASAMAFSPDGSLLALANEQGTIEVLRVADGALQQSDQVEASISQLQWSPDGSLLAAQRNDGAIVLLQPAQPAYRVVVGAEVQTINLLVSSDNQLLIASNATDVRFYSTQTGAELGVIAAPADELALEPGQRLLAVLHAGRVTLWGVTSDE